MHIHCDYVMRFLGIDLGTGSLKLAIVDGGGQVRATACAAYPVATPQPGCAEIDVRVWWRALVDAARRLPDGERARIGAIGLSGQMHGVVLADAAGDALRPAMLWPDTRASALVAGWPGVGGPAAVDTIGQCSGAAGQAASGSNAGEPQPAHRPRAPNPVSPGMAGPLLAWLALHEPDLLHAARWAWQPKDWLRAALGGESASDPSDACATALASPDGDWDDALIDALGLPRALFAPLRASHAVCGALSADAAGALGMPAGIPLATGAGDTPCAALGSGLVHDGDALLTTGTGGQIVVLSERAGAPRAGLHRYRTALGVRYYTMAAMQNVGIALDAARGWLVYPDWRSAYDDAFSLPASPQLSFLPYLTGERSPWMNPAARGGWLGLTLGDARGALMRAAFEGVAFALRAGLDAIRAHGLPVRALRLAGGGSIEPRWRQLLADALDVELLAVDCPHAAARGAALLAGVAAGHWRAAELAALAPAASCVATPGGDAALAARHARFVELYRRTEAWFGAND